MFAALSKKENRLAQWILKTKPRRIIFFITITVVLLMWINSVRKVDWELEVVEVKNTKISETVTASGEVKAEKFTELTFLSSENVKEIIVADGAEVKKGDLIAKLDSTSLYQSYLQAEADLRDKQVTLERVYDQVKGHEKDESYSQKESRTSAEVAKDKAYRAFVIAQKNLGNTNLRAPYDGFVFYGEGSSIGTYSSPASSKFTIVDPKTTYFEAEVNEIDIINIKPEIDVIIELDAFPDQKFTQQIKVISFVSMTTSTGGTAYSVKTTLPENLENKFRIGMNGDANFIVSSKHDVLALPATSVVEEEGKSYVWTINSGNRAYKTEVVTGISSTDDFEIISGLTGGDLVIVRPPAKIKEADKIKILGRNPLRRFF